MKSLYERSIVGWIMNRYVHRIYLAIRPPAPSRVLTRSCERPLPAQCPRSIRRRWNPSYRRNRCTCVALSRFADIRGELHCLPAAAARCLLVRRSVKVLVKLSRARFMLEGRGDKDIQRSGRAWARTPGGSLVSPSLVPGDSAA